MALDFTPESPMPSPMPASPIGVELVSQSLRADDAYARTGHTAKTLVRSPDLRVVLVALKAGSRMAEHQVPHTATVQVVSGSVRLHDAAGTETLAAGQIAVIGPGAPHDVEAVADSTCLITFAWDGACED